MNPDRSQAPEFIIPAEFDLVNPQLLELSGSRKLYYIPTPGLQAVKLEVVGESQRLGIPLHKSLIPSFTLQLLSEGTNQKSESELSEFFDFHASEVHPLISYSHEGMSLLTTQKHLFNVLPDFFSLFDQAVFPEENLIKRKSQRKLSIRLEFEKSASRAGQLFRKALFGHDHPFGHEVSEAEVDHVAQSDLKEYYRSSLWIGTEFFLCGDLNEKTLHAMVDYFDKVPINSNRQIPQLPIPNSVASILEDRPSALQSSIRIGSWSIPKSHPDFLALSVFNTVLGGYFGSRLVKNIREDKGHTYGIYSSLAEIGDFNYWVISADVQKAFRQEVIDEIYREIHRLATEPVEANELEVIRNYLIGQMLSRFSSSFDLMDRFRSVHHSGLDFDFYRKKLAFLRTFTAEDLLAIGEKYFSNPPFTEVIVG
jgi:zinc protease